MDHPLYMEFYHTLQRHEEGLGARAFFYSFSFLHDRHSHMPLVPHYFVAMLSAFLPLDHVIGLLNSTFYGDVRFLGP